MLLNRYQGHLELMTIRSSVLQPLISLILVALTTSCVSSHEVNEDYQEKIPVNFQSYRKRTIVLILVDGLGATMLSENFDSVPQINNFFAISPDSYPLAHSAFPSLTFPNLASLLTLTPISQHSVLGNQMLLRSTNQRTPKLLDFEKRGDLLWLNQIKESSLVYSQLNKKRRSSVSFAQSLYAGATAGNPGDLPMGASYLNKDFFAIDHRNIKALETLLRSNRPQDWPDFVFLHLIGVDGLAHDLGPSSQEIGKYLNKVDAELANIFQLLKSAQESGHYVGSILTADHGFIEVQKHYNLEPKLAAKFPNIDAINEGRTISLYADGSKLNSSTIHFLKDLAHEPEIDLTAILSKGQLQIISKHAQWSFTYSKDIICSPYMVSISYKNKKYCLDELEKVIGPFELPPFAFENLLAYFASPQHPDAVIIAAEGISFIDKYKGHHGGLTQQETLVPLLVNGIKIRNNRIPALFEILKVVFQ